MFFCRDISALQYDPTKEGHEQFELNSSQEKEGKTAKKK